MTDSEIADKIFDILQDIAKAPRSAMTIETQPAKKFHLDSLDMVEIILALEDDFNIEITEQEAERLQAGTIQQMIEEIKKKIE